MFCVSVCSGSPPLESVGSNDSFDFSQFRQSVLNTASPLEANSPVLGHIPRLTVSVGVGGAHSPLASPLTGGHQHFPRYLNGLIPSLRCMHGPRPLTSKKQNLLPLAQPSRSNMAHFRSFDEDSHRSAANDDGTLDFDSGNVLLQTPGSDAGDDQETGRAEPGGSS